MLRSVVAEVKALFYANRPLIMCNKSTPEPADLH